jgi:hypothetical protein
MVLNRDKSIVSIKEKEKMAKYLFTEPAQGALLMRLTRAGP